MTERLVVLSDIWGSKKGLWITSYFGYLQQYFDIEYYDIQQLADIDLLDRSPEQLCSSFEKGGLEMAVNHLMSKEKTSAHYLTFCMGGNIVWEAALRGLPVASITSLSGFNLHLQHRKPDCPVNLIYGEYQENRPSVFWAEELGVEMEVVPKFGCQLYSDEKIIQKVSLSLLQNQMRAAYQKV